MSEHWQPLNNLCGWLCRLPHNDVMRPYAPKLMQAILDVLNTDNEENGLLCLRISFDMHKAFRPTLEEQVQPFMEFVRKVRTEKITRPCPIPPESLP